MVRVAVVRFPGSNCDEDARRGAEQSGAEAYFVWHRDTSLQGADIVVLPGGAKVFNGRANASGQPSDFEDVRSSKLLTENTRRAVMAMSVQAPAAPTPAQTA